ncbi:speckle-type POZ protein A-like [Diachasma alloeum]|uniref:speckle-type POZ protein A-like n=1 Tax=Diachasma alloeum TaxID=454923 RepID=UPI0007381D01|nr:speckle-type POZ protein A-like [Diachasma alloeum]
MLQNPKSLRCEFSISGYPMKGFLELYAVNASAKLARGINDVEGLELDVHVGMKEGPVRSIMEVSVLDSTGSKCMPMRKKIASHIHYVLPFSRQFAKGESLLPNDTLTLLFVVNITTDILTNRRDEMVMPPVESNIRRDVTKLLDNPEYADATITVGNRKFFVLKAILAARSSVFAAMFEHGMRESHEGNVEVTDLTQEVVEEMLHFIYADEVKRPDCFTIELLYAAQKYDLRRLVMLTGRTLLHDLAAENAAERLVIADRFNLKDIKEFIIRFIGGQTKAVMQTEGYKTMATEYVHLALECFETMTLE